MAHIYISSLKDQGFIPQAWTTINATRRAGNLTSSWRQLAESFGFDAQPYFDSRSFTELANKLNKLVTERDEKLRLEEEARRAELTDVEREIENLKNEIAALEWNMANSGTRDTFIQKRYVGTLKTRLAELTGVQSEPIDLTPQKLETINGIDIFANENYIVNVFDRITSNLTSSGQIDGQSLFHLFSVGNTIEFITAEEVNVPVFENIPKNPFVTDPITGIKVYYNPESITQEEVKQIIKNSTAEELQNIDLTNETGTKIISTEPLQEAETETSFIEGILDAMARQTGSIIPQAFADTGEPTQDDSKINFDFDFKIIGVVILILLVLTGAAIVSGGVSSG